MSFSGISDRSRAALVAVIAFGLSTAAIATPARAADDGTVPGAFAERRPSGELVPRVEHVTPDRGFRALTSADGSDDLLDKLGDADTRLLQKAEARGDESVTVLLAATPGEIDQVEATVTEEGGSLGRAEEELGYVRATVPVAAVRDLAALGDVQAIDLNRKYRIPDPVPARGHGTGGVAAPGARTPADNPYLPVAETGATDFIRHHRTWDGRGVTVGVLDSGVDLDHPALQTTTNGEPKVTGWFTATDPVVDGDESWRPMTREVTGPSFWGFGFEWTAPAGDYRFATFWEGSTQGSELAGDVNRDGDIDDWIGILYDPEDHRIWVDSDLDNDFTDEQVMAPYGEGRQVGHFGADDPSTAVVERMPFVVDYREDVDLAPLGEEGVADFVSIGIVSGSHGSHVAGIIAGNKLFGGAMQGAAPGAQVVSARACTFNAGCTGTGLAEGMIDLVLEHDVDVVNVSIGGLPAMNDGSDAIAVLYDEIVEQTGVQIFVSAGNEGPGVNTVGSPSVAENVVSVAASVSDDTWWADYGARVKADEAIFGFSSRGPSESGGLKPTLAAPGAAVSTTPRWLPGSAVPEAGYELPPGYSMFNGTSMASPQATGAAALLISAAGQRGVDATAPALRSALTGSADLMRGVSTTAQGVGLVDTEDAWKLLERGSAPRRYDVSAPVCTPLSHQLPTPDQGTGVYNRCLATDGGQSPRTTRTYTVTVTPRDGGAQAREHRLSWIGNDDRTFAAPTKVSLKEGAASTIQVTARPNEAGEHSAILQVDDPATPGVDQLIPVTVVSAEEPKRPLLVTQQHGEVQRGGTESMFVSVPEGVQNLEVALGVRGGDQVRFVAIDPYGVPVDPQASADTTAWSYDQPAAGIWELEVEARRTSASLDNDYQLTAQLQGVAVTPDTVTIETASVHRPVAGTFTATNAWGRAKVAAVEGQVGRTRDLWSDVSEGQMTQGQIDVARDATRLELTVTPRQADADLDVYLFGRNGLVAQSTTVGTGSERIVVRNPQPGTHAIVVAAVDVPSGTTEFDYHERAYSRGIGTISVPAGAAKVLEPGQALTVDAEVTAYAMPVNGRPLVGRVQFANERGSVIGAAEVLINEVTTPDAEVLAESPAMVGYDLNNAGVMTGDKQIDSMTRPVRWTAEGGVEELSLGEQGETGYTYDINELGESVGQINRSDNSVVPALWRADGTLVELGLPDWLPYDYARAFALNDNGAVVGNASLLRQEDDGKWHEYNDPFIWTEEDGFQKLPHIGADRYLSEPFAINNDGYVVGHSYADGGTHLVMWSPDRTIEDLGNLPGQSGGIATAINEAGVVVGVNGDEAFVWTRAGGMRRLADFGFNGNATKVTKDGWVMGSAELAPYEETPVVWDPQGRIYDVYGMVDPQVFYPVQNMGLNDHHQLLVYGYTQEASGLELLQLPELP